MECPYGKKGRQMDSWMAGRLSTPAGLKCFNLLSSK